MSNMSYCRFRNTLTDLRDCRDHIGDMGLSEDEVKARVLLVKLCRLITKDAEEEGIA